VLAALGIARASVFGTSMGGRVAQMVAIEHPRLVERLVLSCCSPGGTNAVERSMDVRRALSHPDRDTRLRNLHELFYTPARPFGPSRLYGHGRMNAATAAAHLRVSDTHDAADRLHAISAPTLIVHGTDDAIVPVVNADVLAAAIPDATVRLFDRGRHGFFDEFADQVMPLVRAFLATGVVPERQSGRARTPRASGDR
jgi:pimeloyl-ACP methyl ester carboxylesterase